MLRFSLKLEDHSLGTPLPLTVGFGDSILVWVTFLKFLIITPFEFFALQFGVFCFGIESFVFESWLMVLVAPFCLSRTALKAWV